jgi:hypothetical protein
MPDRSKGRGQTNSSPWYSISVVERGVNHRTAEKFTVAKGPEPVEGDHGGGQDPDGVVAPVKKKRLKNCTYVFFLKWKH